MPGQNSISFKIYIAEGNENIEVRRFEVDQEVVTSYEYIRERLQYAFPRLRTKAFKILWKDADGDEVTITSDEEMMIALSEVESDLCKLIVRLPSSENLSDEALASTLAACCPALNVSHVNHVCNSCQKSIQGFRYKCLECVDYYQCKECEHQAIHPEHIMLRLEAEYPTLASMIPKGLHILKQNLLRGSKYVGMASFLQGLPSHHHEQCKDKCGGHTRRRYRHSRANPSDQFADCHFSSFQLCESIGHPINALFNVCKDVLQQQQMETEDSSTQEDNAGSGLNDGPPEPVKLGKTSEKKEEEPSASNSCNKQNPKIAPALKILSEMGFHDEGKWLSNLLERFDGDISKALDHLMQNNK